MKKILVLGLGNDLYGDDGVGLHVVRKLKQEFERAKKRPDWAEDIELEESSLSGIKLLELVTGYDRLLIIDTIKKQNPLTGKFHLFDAKDLRHIPGPSPHYVSIPQTLEIGKSLGLKVPVEVKVIAIEAKDIYNLGEGLSEEMKKRLPQIIKKAKEILKKSLVKKIEKK